MPVTCHDTFAFALPPAILKRLPLTSRAMYRRGCGAPNRRQLITEVAVERLEVLRQRNPGFAALIEHLAEQKTMVRQSFSVLKA